MICGTNAMAMPPAVLVEILIEPANATYLPGAVPSGTLTAVYDTGATEVVTPDHFSPSIIDEYTNEVIFSYDGLTVSQSCTVNAWVMNNTVYSSYSNRNWAVITGGWDGNRPRNGTTTVVDTGLQVKLTAYGQYWATQLDDYFDLSKIKTITISGTGTCPSSNNDYCRIALALVTDDQTPKYQRGSLTNALRSWNGQTFSSVTWDVSDLTDMAKLSIMGCTSSSYGTANIIVSNIMITTVEDVVLNGIVLSGQLEGAELVKYQSGNISGTTYTWDAGIKTALNTYSGNCYLWVELNKTVNLTNVKLVEFTINMNQNAQGSNPTSYNYYCGVSADSGSSLTNYVTYSGNNTGTQWLDVSTFNGAYYLKVEHFVNGWGRTCRLTKIRLLS